MQRNPIRKAEGACATHNAGHQDALTIVNCHVIVRSGGCTQGPHLCMQQTQVSTCRRRRARACNNTGKTCICRCLQEIGDKPASGPHMTLQLSACLLVGCTYHHHRSCCCQQQPLLPKTSTLHATRKCVNKLSNTSRCIQQHRHGDGSAQTTQDTGRIPTQPSALLMWSMIMW